MINDNVKKILAELPPGVQLVAAVKSRTPGEVKEAVCAGVGIVADNYIQEAEAKIEALGKIAQWHFIGHLQKNKIKKAAALFDMIETLDSFETAQILDRECLKINKIIPVLIEVNSACEPQKSGVMPGDVEDFILCAAGLPNIKIMGLMTMGPAVGSPECIRPFFRKTRGIFESVKNKNYGNVEWKYLSMGMSDTYGIAIEEGANIVRVGTAIFGKRG